MSNNRNRIPGLVKRLYAIVAELERLFPGRRFTPDGHLVGSLGEVIAADDYHLILLDSSTPTHDARKGTTRVQIKATQRKSVAMYGKPDHLLVLKVGKDGSAQEVYNGPGYLPWKHAGRPQKNGQRSISLSKLAALMKRIPIHQRLRRQ